MDAFSIRDLRERTGNPFDEELVTNGLCIAPAIELYEEEVLSLGKAARLSGLPVETFVEKLRRGRGSRSPLFGRRIEQRDGRAWLYASQLPLMVFAVLLFYIPQRLPGRAMVVG